MLLLLLAPQVRFGVLALLLQPLLNLRAHGLQFAPRGSLEVQHGLHALHRHDHRLAAAPRCWGGWHDVVA